MKNLSDYQQSLVKWIRKTRPTIYVICRHVSSSGMLRRLSLFAVKQGRIIDLDLLAEKATGYKRDKKREGLRVGGCGMDMGFALVYDLSSAIFPKGFRYRKGEHHRNSDPSPKDPNGGYALKHQWL